MEVGYITKLVKGRNNGNLVGYDENGKIILTRGNRDLKVGYGEITDIYKEYEKYYVCKVKNVQYDYYKEMRANNLIKTLKSVFDYKVGFRHIHNNFKYTFLYNLKFKSIIIIKESTLEHTENFNTIILCPGIPNYESDKTTYNINEYKLETMKQKDPLHYIHNMYNDIDCSKIKWGNILIKIPEYLFKEFSNMEHKEDLNILFEENSKMRNIIEFTNL